MSRCVLFGLVMWRNEDGSSKQWKENDETNLKPNTEISQEYIIKFSFTGLIRTVETHS